MKLLKTKINDLKIIKSKIYKDKRGFLRETYRKSIIGKTNFPFDLITYSKKNVIRGLHFQSQKSQSKIITVTYGKIFDVAVDLRKKSKTFGKSFSILLTDKNCKSIFIPAGFAHGFLTLERENIIHYSCTEYRSIGNEYSLSYKDPKLKVKLPKKKFIVAHKDAEAKSLDELIKDKVIN